MSTSALYRRNIFGKLFYKIVYLELDRKIDSNYRNFDFWTKKLYILSRYTAGTDQVHFDKCYRNFDLKTCTNY